MITDKVFNNFLKRSEIRVQSSLYEQYQVLVKYHKLIADFIDAQWHNSSKTHYYRVWHPEHKEYVRFCNHRKRIEYYLKKYEVRISFSVPNSLFGKGSGQLPVIYSGETIDFRVNSTQKQRQGKAA